jgi:hypothetical protein
MILATTTIAFTIPGSPIGYTRTTQASKWSDRYQRYQNYKADVVNAFLEQVPGDWGHPKPLTTSMGQETILVIRIFFKNRAHPDPSNVLKAIEDALFVNDKYCVGAVEPPLHYDRTNPRVEVEIS